MERCAATAFQLQACSNFVPSLSAEDCTAHQDSFVSQRGVVKRGSEGLVIVKETNDNGCHGAKQATD